jgi:hypothetical protein
MNATIQNILREIAGLSPEWHGSGTMSNIVLEAIASHAGTMGDISHSAETGSGKTTLLFSHLSKHHQVFAMDFGESISQVKRSRLFNASSVAYVEGPSQLTLPQHVFKDKLQIALIDGPHGYPFPDLEYYYFYPQVDLGGLLLLDDINIPSIQRMYEIIKAGDMFELVEVVEYTAFFRRTAAPMVDPLSDSWWLQGYNRAHYEYAMARARRAENAGYRRIARLIPPQLKRLIPITWKTRFL